MDYTETLERYATAKGDPRLRVKLFNGHDMSVVACIEYDLQGMPYLAVRSSVNQRSL